MSASPFSSDPGLDWPLPAWYTLVYTTPQGTIEEANVEADAFDADGPYLIFVLEHRVVTALPHSSVVQWGETEVADKAFKPDNPNDSGKHLVFADETKDPWAHLSGKDS